MRSYYFLQSLLVASAIEKPSQIANNILTRREVELRVVLKKKKVGLGTGRFGSD